MVSANPIKTEHSTFAIVLRGVTWQTYETLMSQVGDDRAWKLAYDQGVLELRMPLEEHEESKGLLEGFVGAIADELEIEVRKLQRLPLG